MRVVIYETKGTPNPRWPRFELELGQLGLHSNQYIVRGPPTNQFKICFRTTLNNLAWVYGCFFRLIPILKKVIIESFKKNHHFPLNFSKKIALMLPCS